MVSKTSFSFNKAIIVNEKMLAEIENRLLEYYSDIGYNAKLENQDDVKFDSLDELVSFENSKINKISELNISGRDKSYTNDINIYIGINSIWGYQSDNTIRVNITADDINKKTVIKENLENIFARNEQDKLYNYIAKSGLLSTMHVISFIVICIFIYNFLTNGFRVENKALLISTVISVFITWISPGLKKLQNVYYPRITFYLGDEIRDYDRKKQGRSSFFWGVIVASVLSFISYIISIIVELI